MGAAAEFVSAPVQGTHRGTGEVAFSAKLAPERDVALLVIERDEGTVQLELGRGEVVRLAQTLLAMAGVMVTEEDCDG
jgi:hypothetical protein